jgi:hypothetical protein
MVGKKVAGLCECVGLVFETAGLEMKADDESETPIERWLFYMLEGPAQSYNHFVHSTIMISDRFALTL